MKKTSSIAPLILGIIGGVLGILGGACITICAEAVSEAGEAVAVEVPATFAIGGWMILVSGILGLVGGCCAKSQVWGSLVELLAGVLTVVGMILSASFGLFPIAAAVLFIVGGAVGLAKKAA